MTDKAELMLKVVAEQLDALMKEKNRAHERFQREIEGIDVRYRDLASLHRQLASIAGTDGLAMPTAGEPDPAEDVAKAPAQPVSWCAPTPSSAAEAAPGQAGELDPLPPQPAAPKPSTWGSNPADAADLLPPPKVRDAAASQPPSKGKR